jgi:long-chain acyl-CoA synthetase
VRDVAELLDIAATRRGPEIAIDDGERRVPYAELRAAAESGAARLIAAGVRAGDRVALMAPNGVAFVAGFFAIVRAGAIVVPLNDHYRRTDLLHFMQSSDAAALVAARALAGLCAEVLQAHGRPCPLLEAEALIAPGDSPAIERPAIDRRDAVLFQFSSGSTGTPKRIARTHENLLYELAALNDALAVDPADRFLGVAPFSHVNGLMRSMLTSLYGGATLHPLPRFDRRAVANLIEQERLTVFIGVPFMFSLLAQAHYHRIPDFGSLRLCVSASAPMPVAHNRLFHQRFGRWVRQLYGSTETGSISVNLDARIEASLDSVGTPLPGVEVEIVREDGSPALPDEVGEVAVRSPAAITGYLDLEEVNREAFRDGWFLTGDLGFRDAEGRIVLRGRKKFQINKGGYKIDPVEIERVLEEHPAVAEAAVVGVPTEYGDERIKAVIVRATPCGIEEIVEYCRPRIADFKIPSVIEFRETLPKSPTGKVRRALLLDDVEEG